jgi:glucose-1-phosphate cytidylyltransferase
MHGPPNWGVDGRSGAMKVVILAGGKGTRLSEETELKPKPMVEIGGRPILWHIMKTYGHAGLDEFVIALGYRSEIIKRYFLDYPYLNASLTVGLKDGEVTVHDRPRENWTVHLVDTGLETMTGGRVRRLADWIGDETFMLTYGDGVADVDVAELLRFHRAHGKLATLTAVRPPARYGVLGLREERVAVFAEKPQSGEGWVNGGFFVLEPAVIEYIAADETHFEREPLERLTREGQLQAYRHTGFWQSMDTLRDALLLNDLWASNRAPWKVWAD